MAFRKMAKKYILLDATDALKEGDEWWDNASNSWLPVNYFKKGLKSIIRRAVDEIPPGRYEVLSGDDWCVGSDWEWFDFDNNRWTALRVGDFRDDRLIRRLVPATDKPKEYLVLRPTDGLQEGDQYWAGPDGWVSLKSFGWINGILYRRPVDVVPAGRYRIVGDDEQSVVGDERLVEWTGQWKRIKYLGNANGPHHCPLRRLVKANQYMLLNPDETPQSGDEYLLDTNNWRPVHNFKHISCLIYRRAVAEVPPGRYRLLCADEQPQDGDEIYRQRSNEWAPSNHSVMSGCHVYRRLVQPAESLPVQYQLLDATDDPQSGDEYFIHSTQRWALDTGCLPADGDIRRRRVEAVPPGKYRLLDESDLHEHGDEAFFGGVWGRIMGSLGDSGNFLVACGYRLRRRLVPHEIDRGGVKRYQLLNIGDQMEAGDEIVRGDMERWESVRPESVGKEVQKHSRPVRRVMKHGLDLQNENDDLRKEIHSLKGELALTQADSSFFKDCYRRRCEKCDELEGKVSDLEKELGIYKGMYRSRQVKHLKLVDALKSFTGSFDELNQILADEI